jgi:hypothetical protein
VYKKNDLNDFTGITRPVAAVGSDSQCKRHLEKYHPCQQSVIYVRLTLFRFVISP